MCAETESNQKHAPAKKIYSSKSFTFSTDSKKPSVQDPEPARTPAGHIVVVNEEVVLGAHAAEEFGHVVGKQEGRLARGPRAAVRSNTRSGVPRKKQPTRGEC